MKGFIEEISQPPTKILMLGPTYSPQAEVVADVAGHYNLLQVRYNLLQVGI